MTHAKVLKHFRHTILNVVFIFCLLNIFIFRFFFSYFHHLLPWLQFSSYHFYVQFMDIYVHSLLTHTTITSTEMDGTKKRHIFLLYFLSFFNRIKFHFLLLPWFTSWYSYIYKYIVSCVYILLLLLACSFDSLSCHMAYVNFSLELCPSSGTK